MDLRFYGEYLDQLDNKQSIMVKEYSNLANPNVKAVKVYTDFETLAKEFGTRQTETYYTCEVIGNVDILEEAIVMKLKTIANQEKAVKIEEIQKQIEMLEEKKQQIIDSIESTPEIPELDAGEESEENTEVQ